SDVRAATPRAAAPAPRGASRDERAEMYPKSRSCAGEAPHALAEELIDRVERIGIRGYAKPVSRARKQRVEARVALRLPRRVRRALRRGVAVEREELAARRIVDRAAALARQLDLPRILDAEADRLVVPPQ